MMVWAAWLSILSAIALIFYLLWRYADKIEREEQFEQQWKDYLTQLWATDPNQAAYMQQYYENLKRM
jgi:peptide methionine sulfoxide reductase MsrA